MSVPPPARNRTNPLKGNALISGAGTGTMNAASWLRDALRSSGEPSKVHPAQPKNAPAKRSNKMNRVRQTIVALGLSAGLLEAVVLAQPTTNPPVVVDSSRLGRVLQPPLSATSDGALSSVAPRPERVEQQRLPQDVQDRLKQFERVREAYLTEQRELQRRLRGATDADRDRIRELIRERRAAWLEQFRTFRQEARERLTELRDALPGHREALDAARDAARQKAEETRERRGDR